MGSQRKRLSAGAARLCISQRAGRPTTHIRRYLRQVQFFTLARALHQDVETWRLENTITHCTRALNRSMAAEGHDASTSRAWCIDRTAVTLATLDVLRTSSLHVIQLPDRRCTFQSPRTRTVFLLNRATTGCSATMSRPVTITASPAGASLLALPPLPTPLSEHTHWLHRAHHCPSHVI